MRKVIDISWHKGKVDLQAIKDSGIEAVILKATDGYFMPTDYTGKVWSGFTDPSFKDNWNKLPLYYSWRGAYHFLRVDNEHAIQVGRPTHKEQIEIYYGELESEGLEWNDYAILDIEQPFDQINYLSKDTVGKRVAESILYTEELFKRKPLIYTGNWWWEVFEDYIKKYIDINEYHFWISHYWNIYNNDIKYNGYNYYEKDNRAFPPEWQGEGNLKKRLAYCIVPDTVNKDNMLLWQYSSSGVISGVNSKIDLNYYLKYEDEWNELRGDEPQDEEPEVPPVEPPIEDPPDEDPETPPESPPEPPEQTGDLKGILAYILKVLEALVAFIKGLLK